MTKTRAHVTHTGKIARLPYDLRMEVNRRLRDGATYTAIAAWLNTHEVAKARMLEMFGGRPIDPRNVFAWRHGGYQEWLEKQE